MNSSLSKRVHAYLARRIYLIMGLLCMFGAVALTANAIMTVSNSAIVGSADVTVDASGTLNLGTSSSTAVVIGQSSVPVTIPGSLNIVGPLSLGSASSTTGQLLFRIASSTYTTTLRASSSQASSLIFTLPGTQGTAGQALLTDGTGKLYFGSASTTLPDTVVQKDANGNVSIGNTVLNPNTGSNTFVIFGDSITANNGGVTSDPQARGWWTWAQAISGQRAVLLANAGVSGNTTAQMLARISTDVLAYNPRFVIVNGGINDATQNVTAATTIANLTSIYAAILAKGGKVIATTITPASTISGAQITTRDTVNSWIRQYARRTPNMYLVDFAAATTDATNLSPLYVTNYAYDGLHPAALGAYKIGTVLAALLSSVLPPVESGPSWNSDSTNLVTNGLLSGTSGSVNNGVTGTSATGWAADAWLTGGDTCAASKTARSDGLGEWQVLTFSTGTRTHNCFLYQYADAGWAPGDSVYLQADFSATTADQFLCVILFTTSGGSVISTTNALAFASTDALNINTGAFTLRTNPVTVPANAAHAIIKVGLVGSGTGQVSRIDFRKVQ